MLYMETAIEENTPTSFGNGDAIRGAGDNVVNELGNYDVICGRHKTAFNNVGNRRFRVTVSLSLARYLSAPTRKDKSIVIKSVAALVRSTGGRFLQRKKGAWVELDEKQTHVKVGHALRDMALAASTKGGQEAHSSTTAAVRSEAPSSSRVGTGKNVPEDIQVSSNASSTVSSQQEEFPERNQESINVHAEQPHDDEFPVPEDMESFPINPVVVRTSQQHVGAATTDESLLVSEHEAPHHEPASPPQDHRCSMDDHMLSWLVNESDSLLSGLHFEGL